MKKSFIVKKSSDGGHQRREHICSRTLSKTQALSVCTFCLPLCVNLDLSLALLMFTSGYTVLEITSNIQQKKKDYLSLCIKFKGKTKNQNKTFLQSPLAHWSDSATCPCLNKPQTRGIESPRWPLDMASGAGTSLS